VQIKNTFWHYFIEEEVVFVVQYAKEGSISFSALGFAASFQTNISLDNCLLVLK
jgi:hypothetical protein